MPKVPRLVGVDQLSTASASDHARLDQRSDPSPSSAVSVAIAALFGRAAVRCHGRFLHETKNVDVRESLVVLALLTAIPANRLAATALAELLGRRRSCE